MYYYSTLVACLQKYSTETSKRLWDWKTLITITAGGEAVESAKKLLLKHLNQQDAVHGQLQLDESF
jgi:hypothetical protein